MVNYSFTVESAEYLIPTGFKRSTIRRRNEKKERQTESTGLVHTWWQHYTHPLRRSLGVYDLLRLTPIEEPILEFVWSAPPEVIYCEGFGLDRGLMELFFLSHYPDELLGAENAFFMIEWKWPPHKDVIS